MKLTVLMDNNTYIDRYFLGEPAVSYYIEDGDRVILFDTGYSSAFLKNAKDMGIDLTNVTDIVLSHGHNDHTGGLKHLLEFPFKNKPILTAHPDVFLKRFDGELEIGSPVTEEEAEKAFELRLSKEPVKISENITFLGEIPTVEEKRYIIGTVIRNGESEPDYMFDDSAMVYKTEKGIYVITGCSHSGICNIIISAKRITDSDRLLGIIGGLHLFEDNERTRQTVDFMKRQKTDCIYPCHCTSFKVRALMDRVMKVEEVGVGLGIQW